VTISITTIPAPYRAGFASLKALPTEAFELLAASLEQAPIAGGLKELAASVVKQASVLKEAEIRDILRSVFSLSAFTTDEDAPLSENIGNLSSAMQATGRPELALSEVEKAQFEKRLARLLTLRTVAVSSKAQKLRLEYPATFHDATVLTDMRPVFDKPDERPLGCAVSHTLQITYHENGDHKQFFLSLDDADLETLIKALHRAITKRTSLKSILKAADLLDIS
jgi:hypothetical protein